MNVDELFRWIGEKLGAAIRFVVEGLAWVFDHLYGAIDSFLQGLTGALGISTSILSLFILVLGLLMLWAGIRAGLRRAVLPALIWAALGVLVLSWLIH